MAILANSTTPVAKTLLLIITIFLSLFTRCRKLPQAETHQVWTRFLAEAAIRRGDQFNLGDLLRRSVKAGQLYSRPGNDLTRRFLSSRRSACQRKGAEDARSSMKEEEQKKE